MLDLTLLPLFVVAALVLIVTPGPDTLFVIAHTLAGGVKRGALASAGIALGIAVHPLLAALGIAALVAASPLLFDAIKIIGGLYLSYIGVMSLKAAYQGETNGAATVPAVPREAAIRVLPQAALTNRLNPKVLICFWRFCHSSSTPSRGRWRCR